jgi:heme-degrading monooxygenase HmoA
MAMFTICTAIIPEGELEKQISDFREAEKRFTQEIGVLERDFYQCIQQPHIIWSNTKWASEKAHNDAAASIMKVRKDDRIGSAYFPPGLYFEIFCNEISEVSYEAPEKQPAGMIVISHGLVALKQLEHWNKTVRSMSKDLSSVEGLRFCRVFYNYYNSAEFVGFMGWSSLEAYQEHRMIDDLTIEERVYTGLKKGSSLLATYNQFQCNPLKVK